MAEICHIVAVSEKMGRLLVQKKPCSTDLPESPGQPAPEHTEKILQVAPQGILRASRLQMQPPVAWNGLAQQA